MEVLHLQTGKIARSEPAADREIEHREFTNVCRHLKPRSTRPDLATSAKGDSVCATEGK
ncbi:hypothetical protein [Paraburkholderia acidipaludis]|uniref:hypothetical protein n=1 Tax=Paraburkholderia acidipaludis TaxID=660537 RepID=UPI0012EC2617|nr:hypothetical protein [Paraburkholderia acidipaludis]